jgi:hypothetical protein
VFGAHVILVQAQVGFNVARRDEADVMAETAQLKRSRAGGIGKRTERTR